MVTGTNQLNASIRRAAMASKLRRAGEDDSPGAFIGPRDFSNLRASGLKPETWKLNGLYTENDPRAIGRILKWKGAGSSGGLVIPYRSLAGELTGFARVRPHEPRMRNGKLVKYENPVGDCNHAYFPVASLEKLRDGESPIFVTEGEKKALALSQLHLAAIGISGVDCWSKDGELLPDLAQITWKGREVYIAFDYDEKPKTRQQVAGAMCRLARALRIAGAKDVRAVELPPGPDGVKQGVDDFLVAHGAEAFHRLVARAKPVAVEIQPLRVAAGRTETANARRLVAKFGDNVRWIGAWDKWLVWDRRRWKLDNSLRVESFAKQVADRLWKEIGKTNGELSREDVVAMYTFAKASNSAGGIRNMVALAKSEPGVSVDLDDLDADPWLLNVQNGTLDLRTGELRDHRQEDFITKLAPVTFDARATCPQWQRFLHRIFDNHEELISYVQRLVGYSLTGSTEEHILPFLYGDGANGKSTFAEVLLTLMGRDYAMKAPPDLLLAKKRESHPTERADLYGKRFVACIETEDGRRMAEALVKELTGGDRIRARRMREDFWEFAPTHHVWLAGNYKPTIRGRDHGIWRRIKLIPFTVTIPKAEQDRKLPAKLAQELSGILNWALEGLRAWRESGMQEPLIVQAATQSYSKEMDLIGQFIDESCERGVSFIVPATGLYQAFRKYVGDETELSQRKFGEEIGKRGFERIPLTTNPYKGCVGYRGLRLRPGQS